MQPDNPSQWNLRYLLSEAIRNGSKLSLDTNGEILVQTVGGWQLLTEQTVSRVATDGKRRGFNGKQPRTSDGIKHPCMVTRADGTTYDFVTKSRKPTDAYVEPLIGRLDPSNEGNPDN